MPLRLSQLRCAIKCDENELETFDVKQEAPSLISAFVASEAGKKFRLTYGNKFLDTDLSFHLHIDGELVRKAYVSAGKHRFVEGIYKNSTSILPFKFQELELTQTMGTIEVRAFRRRFIGTGRRLGHSTHGNGGLHGGRVSERSKKAGWHHVSTADEIPAKVRGHSVISDKIDPPNAPYATFKIFYRPRELLMAQGIIPQHDAAAKTSGGSKVNGRKRPREDDMPGPSKRHTAPTIKEEEISATARAQRIQDLQAELNSLMAGHSNPSVKREPRFPSPIVAGKAAGEVVDLTLED